MRSSRRCGWYLAECGWDLADSGWDLSEWLERLTANAEVATVLGSIPASSDTVEVESEERQMKQWWIHYIKKINPPPHYFSHAVEQVEPAFPSWRDRVVGANDDDIEKSVGLLQQSTSSPSPPRARPSTHNPNQCLPVHSIRKSGRHNCWRVQWVWKVDWLAWLAYFCCTSPPL